VLYNEGSRASPAHREGGGMGGGGMGGGEVLSCSDFLVYDCVCLCLCMCVRCGVYRVCGVCV
jgi:hypothetical protein